MKGLRCGSGDATMMQVRRPSVPGQTRWAYHALPCETRHRQQDPNTSKQNRTKTLPLHVSLEPDRRACRRSTLFQRGQKPGELFVAAVPFQSGAKTRSGAPFS